MSKKSLLPGVVLFLLFTGIQEVSFGQASTGIHFTDSSWQTLLNQAKTEHKLIFMDAHTTWCGPCKWMDKNVFTDPGVRELYDRNFINAYTDMEKGEGIELRKKYEVRAYPTYLFINGDGEVVHKAVGESTIAEFIQYGLDALSPTFNLSYFQKNYAKNSDNYNFVHGYLKALQNASETDSANAVALQYLLKQKPELWMQNENWQLILTDVLDASSPVFKYLVGHQKQFENLFGKSIVSGKIYDTYLAWPRHYLLYPEMGPVKFDKIGFNRFITEVKSSDYIKKAEIIDKSNLTILFGLRKWDSYSNTVSRMIKDHIIPMNVSGAEELYNYTDMLYRFAGDNQIALSDAVDFAKILSEKISGISDQSKASYLDMYANLLDKTGDKLHSKIVRGTINQKYLSQAKAASPMQELMVVPKQK
ncbi:MAG: thioredoxin fold domain-containing protein [Ginsengibacter sp.]